MFRELLRNFFSNLQMVLGDDVIGFTVDQCPIAPTNVDIMCITPLFLLLKFKVEIFETKIRLELPFLFVRVRLFERPHSLDSQVFRPTFRPLSPGPS